MKAGIVITSFVAFTLTFVVFMWLANGPLENSSIGIMVAVGLGLAVVIGLGVGAIGGIVASRRQ